ncbi:MAG TPA: AAA family ATPase [Acidimicrobiales bacterium]|nr:AAA family ATPase [Acidimicrobiales bacterium]
MPTRTATVLFTDLVGSVETAARLGPAEAEVLRKQHDSLLSDVIGVHRGTVVKRLGDGFMATFDSASDAVTASIAIQQAVHRQNQRLAMGPLSVRVGISGGDVSFEDGDCFGAPVAEASRLCAAASGGQTLAADIVRVTSRGLAGRPFRTAGDITLKGMPDPVEVVEVAWEPPDESRTPLPPRLASSRIFVGRQEELSLLDGVYREVANGGGRRVVLIHAEPGMGKTSISVQAVRNWHAGGASVGVGYCDEELTMPYAPVSGALDHLVRHAPAHVLAAHVARHGAAAAHLVPALTGRVDVPGPAHGAEPETERYLGFAAAADLLASLGEDSPVVLLLEDLHWADAGTLTFLRHLAANAVGARMVVLVTFRDSEVSPGHPLHETLAALRRLEGVTRLPLTGLATGDVRELVSERAGGNLDGVQSDAVARQLADETAGNPFYLCELLDHLAETGRLVPLVGPAPSLSAADGSLELPESIREVIGARINRLGPGASDVLTVAAVIGNQFELETLESASRQAPNEVLQVLERARAASLLREVPDRLGTYAFSHALVAHTLLQGAGATRRARLHQQVAMALEQAPDAGSRQAELAHHWSRAVYTVNAGRARDYAERAAAKAAQALAPDEAARWYEKALELHGIIAGDDSSTRVTLLTKLGVAQAQAGSSQYRETLLQAARLARQVGDAVGSAQAVMASNRGMFTAFGLVDDEKVELLEGALRLVDPADRRTRSELLAVLANELAYDGDYPRRRAMVDESLSLARAVGDPALLYRVHNLVFHALWNPDTLHERLAMSAESIELAQQVGDLGTRFWAEHRHHINLLQAGLIDDADRCLHNELELAERLAQPLHRWVAGFSNATRHFLAGNYMEAEAISVEAFKFGEESSQPEALNFFQLSMMNVFWQSGRQFDLALAEAMADGLPGVPALKGGVAMLASDSGDVDRAARYLDEGTATRFTLLKPDPGFLTGVLCFAETAIRLGDRRAAEPLYDMVRPWAGQIGLDGNTCTGPLLHYIASLGALLGDVAESDRRFAESEEQCQRIGARFFEARTLVEWSAMLLKRGGPDDMVLAEKHLARALSISEECGYAAVARRAAELQRF